MRMETGIWALAAQLLALLAIPHAAAQALSKFLAVSTRPALTATAKTMDASAYAALAIVSALIIRIYFRGAQQHPSPDDLDAARKGISLGAAIGQYTMIYVLALIGLGAIVISAKVVLRTENPKRLKKSVVTLWFLVQCCWWSVLDVIDHTAHLPSLHPLAILSLVFIPPLPIVAGVFALRLWDPRRAGNLSESPAISSGGTVSERE